LAVSDERALPRSLYGTEKRFDEHTLPDARLSLDENNLTPSRGCASEQDTEPREVLISPHQGTHLEVERGLERRRRRYRRHVLGRWLQSGDEAKPAPMHGFDDSWRLRIVAERLSELAKRAGERVVRYHDVAPHRRMQLVLGHEDARPFREVAE